MASSIDEDGGMIYSDDCDSQCSEPGSRDETFSPRRNFQPKPVPRKRNVQQALIPSVSDDRIAAVSLRLTELQNSQEKTSASAKPKPIKSKPKLRDDTKILVVFTAVAATLQMCMSMYMIYLFAQNLYSIQSESQDLEVQLIIELSQLKATLLQEIELSRSELSKDIDTLKTEISQLKSLLNPDSNRKLKLLPGENIHSNSYSEISPNNPNEIVSEVGDKVSIFRKSILEMKSKAPGQFSDTWKELYSGTVDTMTDSTTRPGSIVILVPPSMQSGFVDCFVKNLASSINTAHGKKGAQIKEIDSLYLDSFSTLTDIHDDIKSYLTNIGKSLIVNNPDNIRREDHLMIFQAFCDNVMAFDNAATFLFVVRVPEQILQDNSWSVTEGQKIARSILHNSWQSTIALDKRVALIARISVNVILLKDGGGCDQVV